MALESILSQLGQVGSWGIIQVIFALHKVLAATARVIEVAVIVFTLLDVLLL